MQIPPIPLPPLLFAWASWTMKDGPALSIVPYQDSGRNQEKPA